jgi:spore germination protein YaaH
VAPAAATGRATASASPGPPREHRTIAWAIPDAASFESAVANADDIDVVSFAAYRLAFQANGTRLVDWGSRPVDAKVLAALAKKGKLVLPLVGCLDVCAAQLGPILDDPAGRAAHAEVLAREVEGKGLGGLFVDYEDLGSHGPAVSAFVADLAARLHAKGRRLGIAVPEPCGADPSCRRAPYPFRLAELAASVDYLAVMEYDFDVDAKAPPAPRDWVLRGLRRVRQDVPELLLGKVYVGIPFYGRMSRGLAPDTAVLYSEVLSGSTQGKHLSIVSERFDPEGLAEVAEVVVEKKKGTLYYEDHRTLEARLRLIEAEGLANVAIWRLGGEAPCGWPTLRRWRGQAAPACPAPP